MIRKSITRVPCLNLKILRSLVLGSLMLGGWPLAAIASPWPTTVPIEKRGSCPVGYSSSGNYCLPRSQARPAVLKQGSCPIGWFASGNYCLAGQTARPVVPKLGSCPVGSYASGNYCVLTR